MGEADTVEHKVKGKKKTTQQLCRFCVPHAPYKPCVQYTGQLYFHTLSSTPSKLMPFAHLKTSVHSA